MQRLLADLPAISTTLREALELRPAAERAVALGDCAAFHVAWAELCAAADTHLLPQAIAPLHGLEAWSALLVQLHGPDIAARGAAHQAFVRTEGELLDVRTRIATQVSTTEGDDHERDGARLRDDEARLLTRWRDLRERLAQSDAGMAALRELPRMTTRDLGAGLGASDVLIVTVALDADRAIVLVVKAALPAVVITLRGLQTASRLVRRFHTHGRRGLRGASLRDAVWGQPNSDAVEPLAGAADEPGDSRWASFDDIAAAMREAFWDPLGPSLHGISHAQLVTGPGHHGLPLECGAPSGLRVHRCFGLPAYLSLRDSPRPMTAMHALDVVSDPAWAWSPIPFVATEEAVVRELLAPRVRVQALAGRPFLRGHGRAERLLLGVHGGIAGRSDAAHGFLVVDSTTKQPARLDAAAVDALPAGVSEVFVSACLGGVVGSNDAGSALGLCSQWQLRGITAVVGCLGPVEDHVMPLLAALYWTGRQRGRAPHDALDDAKAAMRSGTWPGAIVEPLRRAYRRTMLQVLQRARWRDGTRAAPARLAAASVAGWLLSPYVRSVYFDQGSLDDERHRAFSAACCDSPSARSRLVGQCLAYLIDERAQPEDLAVRAFARASIENVCALTQCFGREMPAPSRTPS